MSKSKEPLLLIGVLPKKKSVVAKALLASEKLLDSVAYVTAPGDTAAVLTLLRKAIREVNASK